jgi:hypothetical protein
MESSFRERPLSLVILEKVVAVQFGYFETIMPQTGQRSLAADLGMPESPPSALALEESDRTQSNPVNRSRRPRETISRFSAQPFSCWVSILYKKPKKTPDAIATNCRSRLPGGDLPSI